MLSDNGEYVENNSAIPNLFDNGRPDVDGNALVRARVLEYLCYFGAISPSERVSKNAFSRLGYEPAHVREVLQMFLERRLITRDDALQTETVVASEKYVATQLGRDLWNKTTALSVYLDCVRRGMYARSEYVKRRSVSQSGVVVAVLSKPNLLKYIAYAQSEEQKQAQDYDRKTGREGTFIPSDLSARY
jgi:hypothetical protein